LEKGGSVAAAYRDASIGITQSSSGLLQGSNARAMLAEAELVPGVDGHGTQLVRPDTQSARKMEALESHVHILLPSLGFTGKGERMAGMRETRAATIATRLKSSLPPGEGEPSSMDKVAELIAEGYSDSRIQAFSTQQKRFIEFCESDGYDWLVSGKHAMCAWIAHMYETSTIAGSTMDQYVSVNNRAYETSELDPPGKQVNVNKQYVEVRKSIDGFKRAPEKRGAAGLVPTLPTPDYVIGALCAIVRRMLTPPISVSSLEMARSGLANVWQYFNISRPTMTSAMK
jgi:hypothetical protein